MGKKKRTKKEAWLIFYRTKRNKLESIELDGGLNKEEALELAANVKGFYCYETGIDGPIVKRLCYV